MNYIRFYFIMNLNTLIKPFWQANNKHSTKPVNHSEKRKLFSMITIYNFFRKNHREFRLNPCLKFQLHQHNPAIPGKYDGIIIYPAAYKQSFFIGNLLPCFPEV